jgi:hypothetical protein
MRTLIAVGMFVLASTAMQTSANAQYGTMGRACKIECNIIPISQNQVLKPNEQVCVKKCMARKKAAQH